MQIADQRISAPPEPYGTRSAQHTSSPLASQGLQFVTVARANPETSISEKVPAYVAGLLRPTAYDHPADELVLHNPRISWVIVAGSYAYKLKKPVNLGFVGLLHPRASV
jgi:hypothetical protein